ncbi:hypothetical protein GCM10011380_30080 [Sphingomonas metalli]|uniref:Cell wall hydrolase SleB domain-containing protein n=1 Tax=Sphingomonas metalli TaxID=1779358 RepID=A0A916TCY8_9SPHN|nr:cell wall hydrolase [Sphingomonas metalli]GGB38650.1 hypothetical protein GCM10011380_30080 [Sphingomonas metalli]
MTLISRVASFAAMTLTAAGLLTTSPGWATGLDQSLIAAPGLATINTLAPHMVPAVETTATVVEPAAPEAPAPTEQTGPQADQDDQDFATLADAVAAQDASAEMDEATRCLAGAIYFEAKGEPLTGQLAVAEVVINRAKSGRFPTDLCSVIKQRGQFGFVRDGRIPAIDQGRTSWRTAVAVARVALADMWDSAASNALYFNAHGRSPGAGIRKIAAIGNHVFYR